MVSIEKAPNQNILYTTAINKLDEKDYDRFLPVAEEILDRYGKIRWYFEMNDFDGWTAESLWTDVKFDFKHTDDFEKIAIVGRKEWMDWMTQMMKPFTSADVRFFSLKERDLAKEWIRR